MKKLVLMILLFSQIGFLSCTPQAIEENLNNPELCCGDDGYIPPPPPPKG